MDYRREKSTIYLRVDKGEEVVETIKRVCAQEQVKGGYFQGIGACDAAVLSTWITEREDFIQHDLSGMLEMISLMGNILTDQNEELLTHSHAVFSYLTDDGEVGVTAGHLEEAWISYTGEIVLTPAEEKISCMFDQRAGIDVWKLS